MRNENIANIKALIERVENLTISSILSPSQVYSHARRTVEREKYERDAEENKKFGLSSNLCSSEKEIIVCDPVQKFADGFERYQMFKRKRQEGDI